MQLLAQAGLAGLNLRAVARALDASPGTLYNYFDSKDAMLEALFARSMAPATASLVRRGSWDADLTATMTAMHDAFSRTPATVELLSAGLGTDRMDPVREHVLSLLAEGGLSVPDQLRALNLLVALVIGDVMVHHSHMRDQRTEELRRRRALPADTFPHIREAAAAHPLVPDTEGFRMGLAGLMEVIRALT